MRALCCFSFGPPKVDMEISICITLPARWLVVVGVVHTAVAAASLRGWGGGEEVSLETGGIVVGQEREIRKRELCTVQYTPDRYFIPKLTIFSFFLIFSPLTFFFCPPPLSLFSSDFDDVKIQIGIQLHKNALERDRK
jgi:hypothetical protein